MGERVLPEVSRLGPYRLVEKLGAGGMGAVFRAVVDENTSGLAEGDVVAIKVVHPHLAEQPQYRARSRREAEAGRRVEHANVVRTHDCGAYEMGGRSRDVLVMEYVEGKTLGDLVRDLGPLPEAMLRAVAIQAAEGLAAIHAAGVVHRDLKPDNLLVTADDQVRIMDLGVARLVEESLILTREGDFVGSFLYGAPGGGPDHGGTDAPRPRAAQDGASRTGVRASHAARRLGPRRRGSRELDASDAHVLYGSYPPSGGLGGLSDAVLDHFGATGLEKRLELYLSSTPLLIPIFAAMLRHERPTGEVDTVGGDALHSLFCRLLQGLGDRRPTLWVVEDLHFAPGESLSIALSMARAVAGHPVLLLLTTRPGIPKTLVPYFTRLENLRWSGGDPRDLAETPRILLDLLEGAPADRRRAMRENVPLHRRILEAVHAEPA